MYFVYRDMKKMKMWHAVICPFKIRARVSPYALVLFYIVYYLLYVKWNQLAQLAGTRTRDSHDLGSNPRSHTFPILFFISNSHAALTLMLTILHQNAPSTCPRALTSKARIGKHATLQSNASHWIKKVNKFSPIIGPGFQIYTSNSGVYPPWFDFLFIFHFLNCYVIYLFYLF